MQANHNSEEQIRNGEELLQTVIGARLTSVQFVMNYLILGFDARGALTTCVWPTLNINRRQFVFGDDGYRDSLCSLITVKVTDLEISSDEVIKVRFENNVKLDIPLGTYSLPGERAIFTTPKRQLCTW